MAGAAALEMELERVSLHPPEQSSLADHSPTFGLTRCCALCVQAEMANESMLSVRSYLGRSLDAEALDEERRSVQRQSTNTTPAFGSVTHPPTLCALLCCP